MSEDEAPHRASLGDTAAQAGNLVLKAGVSAARIVAEAASGRPQPAREGEGALAGLLRHGSTAFGSLAGIAFKAARERMASVPADGRTDAAMETPAQPQPRPSGPELHPGGVARIPLSIDNSGAEPMLNLVPRLTGATREGEAAEPAFLVRFTPEIFTVAPRDFEKLVVTIELAADIAPGAWGLFFTLYPDGSDPHELPFQVAADKPG